MKNWPAVTALCPTYGRYERLRDAVACFLLQDYPGERRLQIFNDAEQGLVLWAGDGALGDSLAGPGLQIDVDNCLPRYETLGHKRQALLDAAQAPVVAHWDDDDLYLPWHLTSAVSALWGARGAACAKARTAWWAVGPCGAFEVRGIHANTFEGQMVFLRGRALDLGGYALTQSGQAAHLLAAFRQAGELHAWSPAPAAVSYVYRWGGAVRNTSPLGNDPGAPKAFAEGNTDFGDGSPIIEGPDPLAWARDRIGPQFRQLAERIPGSDDRLTEEDGAAIRNRLLAALDTELETTHQGGRPRHASDG